MFEKAYLIHLFQDMIEAGVQMAHADTPGNYIEIDTQQDFELAQSVLARLSMAKLLFPASVVGSMPRSAFVQDLINDKPPLSPERYEAEMDAAVRYIVAVQEHAGLDVVTDGEWRRKSYIGVIAELAHGFELGYNPRDGRPWTVVVDKLAPKQPGFIAQEIAFLKRITSRQIKATLPAPALLGERMWHPEKSAKAYPKRDDFVRDCVPILRRELELIRAGRRGHHPDRRSASLPVRRSGGARAVCQRRRGGRFRRRHGQRRRARAARARSSPCICAAAPARAFAARRSSRAATIRSSIN